MSLIDKIKEFFRRNKTPKLDLGIEEKLEQVEKVNLPYTYQISQKGEVVIIKSIEFNNKLVNSNGEKTDILIAKIIYRNNEKETERIEKEDNVAFEMTYGSSINTTTLNKLVQYYTNARYNGELDKNCTYVGKITSNTSFLELNNKSEFVEKYIKEKVSPRIEKENEFKTNLKQENISNTEEIKGDSQTQSEDIEEEKEM